MSEEFADDIQAAGERLTETEEYEERFVELFEEGVDAGLEPRDNLDQLMEKLTNEFLLEDDNWETDAGAMSELLVETFKRATADRFIIEVRERAEDGVFDWSQVDIDPPDERN